MAPDAASEEIARMNPAQGLHTSSRRVRSRMRSLLARIALQDPFLSKPQRWGLFAARVRVGRAAKLVGKDIQGALQLLEPVLGSSFASPQAWRVALAAYERQGDVGDALDSARRAVESGEPDVELLLHYRRMAVKERRNDHRELALQALASRPPASQKELDRVAEALRFGDLEHARRFRQLVVGESRTETMSVTSIDEALDELRLIEAHQHGPDDFTAEWARIAREGGRPLLVVTRALSRRRAWNELAAIVTAPGNEISAGKGELEDFPVFQARAAARKAFAGGWTSAASALAERSLAAQPGDADMRVLIDEANDQATISRKGWQPPQRAETPYQPDPDTTLAVLGQSLPIRSGGYATRSHGVLTGLAARGWTVHGVTRLGFPYDQWWKADDPRPVPRTDTVDGITYHRLLRDGVRDYPRYPLAGYVDECASGVVETATAIRASLIHASSLYDVGMAGLAAARRLGLPFIYEMRGLKQLLEVSRDPSFAGSDRYRFLELLEAGVARQADVVFVITEALGREMAAHGVDEDRLIVVPNGVHTDRFHVRERDRELEQRLGLSGKTVIGYVGGLVHYEGIELLLDAMGGLKQTRDDVHLLVVGDGAHERAIRAHADRLRLGDVATFTGRIPHEDVERYLSLIDIAPLPRLPLQVCELISPIKPFESMAMGKVVVVSDVAALLEIVEDGKTGRVFRKGDSDDLQRVLDELIRSPDQRRKLAQAAREWVARERDWATITSVVDTTYRNLLNHPPPAP